MSLVTILRCSCQFKNSPMLLVDFKKKQCCSSSVEFKGQGPHTCIGLSRNDDEGRARGEGIIMLKYQG